MSGLRILIVRTGAMGDILHALPAVAGLREVLPDAEIGWVVEPAWRSLLRTDADLQAAQSEPRRAYDLVNRLHFAETRRWRKAPLSAGTAASLFRLRQDLRRGRYDLAIDLQGSLRSAILGRMAGTSRLFGSEHPRELVARRFYTNQVALLQTNVIQQAAELVSAAVGIKVSPTLPRMPFDMEAQRWSEELLGGERAPLVLLAPTAGWGAKEWGTERFGQLGRQLANKGYRVLVNAPLEGSVAAGRVASLAGGTLVACSLAQLMALTRRAAFVVGGDTGPVHLSAALGRPTLALFGPTDPARNGPAFPGAKVSILRHPGSITSLKRRPETEAGLERITVEEVLAAALSLTGDRVSEQT